MTNINEQPKPVENAPAPRRRYTYAELMSIPALAAILAWSVAMAASMGGGAQP